MRQGCAKIASKAPTTTWMSSCFCKVLHYIKRVFNESQEAIKVYHAGGCPQTGASKQDTLGCKCTSSLLAEDSLATAYLATKQKTFNTYCQAIRGMKPSLCSGCASQGGTPGLPCCCFASPGRPSQRFCCTVRPPAPQPPRVQKCPQAQSASGTPWPANVLDQEIYMPMVVTSELLPSRWAITHVGFLLGPAPLGFCTVGYEEEGQKAGGACF